MKRRAFIGFLAGSALIGFTWKERAMAFGFGKKGKGGETEIFPYQLSDEQWKQKLTPDAYRVLRKAGTERSGSSPLDREKRKGAFHCKGCDHPLFASNAKFDSGTGWPSFFKAINDKAVGFSADSALFYTRTEEHCANCGGHLGHIFDDGPKPTGKRHCINGVAMVFHEA